MDNAGQVLRTQPDLPIVTARLFLRPFVPADLESFYQIRSRADVARYLYQLPMSRAEAAAAFERRVGRATFVAEGDALGLAIERRDTGEMIGDIVLFWASAQHRQGEIGFVLHPDHHGQGFAREAAEALLRVGFVLFGFHRIIGRCDARNAASAGLLARLGMRQEAHFRQNEFVKGEWCDELVFAILAEEWQSEVESRKSKEV